MHNISVGNELDGSILDLGGGGEGIVGRVYGSRVTAIDNRQDELDEAPDGPRKLLMDACALSFAGDSFDHVTAFYFFLYLDAARRPDAVREAYRVLRPGGTISVWDADIDRAEPFLTELQIDANGTSIHVTYGIYKENARQDAELMKGLLGSAGFREIRSISGDGHFNLTYEKPDGLL